MSTSCTNFSNHTGSSIREMSEVQQNRTIGVVRLPSLRNLWSKAAAGDDPILRTGPYGGYLPHGIHGVDFSTGYELREGMLEITGLFAPEALTALKGGHRIEIACLEEKTLCFLTPSGNLIGSFDPIDTPGQDVRGILINQLLADLRTSCSIPADATPLWDYAECRVRDRSVDAAGKQRLKLYARFVFPLQCGTVESLFAAAKLLTPSQLQSGQLSIGFTKVHPFKLSDSDLRSYYASLRTIPLGEVDTRSSSGSQNSAVGTLRDDEYENMRAKEMELLDRFLTQLDNEQKLPTIEVENEPAENSEAEVSLEREKLTKERERFREEQTDFEAQRKAFESEKSQLDLEKQRLMTDKERFNAERVAFDMEKQLLATERAELESQRTALEQKEVELDNQAKQLEEKKNRLASNLAPVLEELTRSTKLFDEARSALGVGISSVEAALASHSEVRHSEGTPATKDDARPKDDDGPKASIEPEDPIESENVAASPDEKSDVAEMFPPAKRKPHTPAEKQKASQEATKAKRQELIQRQIEKQRQRKAAD